MVDVGPDEPFEQVLLIRLYTSGFAGPAPSHAEAAKHCRLLGLKNQASLQYTLRMLCRMRPAVHAWQWLEQWQDPTCSGAPHMLWRTPHAPGQFGSLALTCPPHFTHGKSWGSICQARQQSIAWGVQDDVSVCAHAPSHHEFVFDAATHIGLGMDPGAIQAVQPQGLNLKHITTWDVVWEVYLDPKWACQQRRLYGAQNRALEQFFKREATQASASDPALPRQPRLSRQLSPPSPPKAQAKAAEAKPAPQPRRWVDRDCNVVLNMQRKGESRWHLLELC
ncbi:hypothetical protein QJQ45_002047 [Haematococcus lacustris]|nr:hypothetical protein QJQ45_002047 [Haematococcus lacustris]